MAFAAVHLPGGEEAEGAAAEARPEPATQAAASAPSIVRESPRVLQGRPPPPEMRPLFDPEMRLHLGEAATLKFAAADADRRGQPREVTASVFHGRDPERRLPVHESDEGVYEVPFQPYGPGQYRMVLSVNGVPAVSQRLGVIGAAGRIDGAVDIADPLSVDPRDLRARTGGKFRRR
ncbi:MAG TPA: hypothetical protein VI356_05195 [Myxococcales bacterium]